MRSLRLSVREEGDPSETLVTVDRRERNLRNKLFYARGFNGHAVCPKHDAVLDESRDSLFMRSCVGATPDWYWLDREGHVLVAKLFALGVWIADLPIVVAAAP
jgi:hypothetical protein